MLILGIETSCDETAAAVVVRDAAGRGDDPLQRRAQPARRTRALWRRRARARGPRPRRPARRHHRAAPSTRPASRSRDLDAIAATAGPGLIGGVLVGLTTGQGAGRGARQAADRGQPPRGPRAHRAAHRRRRLPLSACCWSRAATASSSLVARRRRLRALGHHHRRRARRGLRQGRPSCSASAIPAAPRSSGRPTAAIPTRFRFPRPLLARGPARFLVLRPQDRRAPRGRADRAAHATRTSPTSPRASRPAVTEIVADRARRSLARLRPHPGSAGAGRRRRRRRQPGASATRLRAVAAEAGARLVIPPPGALHRQRRDGRLGRRRALRPRPDRCARRRRRGRAGRSTNRMGRPCRLNASPSSGGGAWGTALAQAAAMAGREVVTRRARSRDASPRSTSSTPTAAASSGVSAVATRSAPPTAPTADADIVILAVPAQPRRASALERALRSAGPSILSAKGLEHGTLLRQSEILARDRARRDPLRPLRPELCRRRRRRPAHRRHARGRRSRRDLAARRRPRRPELPPLCGRRPHRRRARRRAQERLRPRLPARWMAPSLGASARSALIARAYAEMSRMVAAMGGSAATLTGLAGLGDLTLSCTSPQSRNYRFGIALGRGDRRGIAARASGSPRASPPRRSPSARHPSSGSTRR